ncbi:MAG TPA: PEP/pyruvate-binding domain-containing protein [Candidatus Hydrogenedens sp.]|nr:PEP/pyruvate-binding domain-containing protein [Candidatus Hydrogenedens sp.]
MRFWLINNEELVNTSRIEIGGKGYGLVQMRRQGLRVPLFGIINTEGVKRRIWHTHPELQQTLLSWCDEVLQKSSNMKLAVRSSACEEDQEHRSFAGKFLTEFISNADELIPTLDKLCAHYEMVIETEHNYVGPRGLAIILQEFISGKISGVCFSAEPINAHPEKAYCEMVVGENKMLVDGETQPTRILFHPSTAELIELQEGIHGPKHIPDQLLAELSTGLIKMEWNYRTAVDIEWTWNDENIWFLQVRPITAIHPSQELYPTKCATCWFFDQRFIEPITPITKTTLIPLILRKAIEEALSMRKKIEPVEPYYFGGQVYIPHQVYFDLLEGCPKWWLASDLKLLFPDDCGCPPRQMKLLGIRFWLDAVRSLLEHWQDAIFVLHRWEQWKKQLSEKLNLWREEDLPEQTSEAWLSHWEQWQKLSEEFLEIHRWAILWSSYVYRLGGKYIVHRKEKHYPSITTHANYMLTSYLSTRDVKLLNTIRSEYSHRTESLDFMSPRWGEWLSGEEQNQFFETQLLEEKYDQPIIRNTMQKKVGWLYRIISRFIHLREEQRFEWEKILYIQKKLLKEAGRKLAEKGILNNQNQIWWITWQELINALIEGKQINFTDISTRKHQWCVEHTFPKPSFINYHPVPHIDRETDTWYGWGISGGRVKGTAYVTNSPTSLPTDIPHPRILITTCLNPGQTWCLQYWDGVLLERGSELSHPAIIAREMNIPMIANLPEITHKLNTGDVIYLDATNGKVTRIPTPTKNPL